MAFAIAGSTALAIGVTAAGIGAAAGGISAIGSNQKRKAAEKDLDAFAQQSPLYKGSKPIDDYYQEAMNRYKESPYQSQQYQVGAMNARRATAQGINALQDRRSAIGGISALQANQNAAMQNLGAQAEAQRNARFGQYGQATQMKNADLLQQFDINKMTPYNRQFGLKQMKSAAANQQYAQDVSNTFGALGNLASVGMSAAGAGGGGGGSNYGQPKSPVSGLANPEMYQKNIGYADLTNMKLPNELPAWAKAYGG